MKVFQCDLCESTYKNENDAASVRSGCPGVNNSESIEFVHICPDCRELLGLTPVNYQNRLKAKKTLITLLKFTRRAILVIKGKKKE